MSKADVAWVVLGSVLILAIYARCYFEMGAWSRNLPEMDFKEFHKFMTEHQSGENNDRYGTS